MDGGQLCHDHYHAFDNEGDDEEDSIEEDAPDHDQAFDSADWSGS